MPLTQATHQDPKQQLAEAGAFWEDASVKSRYVAADRKLTYCGCGQTAHRCLICLVSTQTHSDAQRGLQLSKSAALWVKSKTTQKRSQLLGKYCARPVRAKAALGTTFVSPEGESSPFRQRVTAVGFEPTPLRTGA